MARKSANKQKKFVNTATALLIVLGIIVGVIYHHYNKPSGKVTIVNTSAPHTLQNQNSGASSNPSSINNGTVDKTSATPSISGSGGGAPSAPVDSDFVSSHTIGLNQTEESTCAAQPGVSCTITFTSDGLSASLPSQTIDANGYVIWDWKPSDIGLSAGSWKVTATATQNGKSSSTNDAKPLEVQS